MYSFRICISEKCFVIEILNWDNFGFKFFVPLKNFIFVAQFLNDNEKNYTVPFLVDFYHAFFSRWNKIRKTVFC